jgi:two-component system, LytTR family, sensor kinase
MKHPLLSNLRFLTFYGVFLVCSGNSKCTHFVELLQYGYCAGICQYLCTVWHFAVLGLSIWYVVKYNSPETYKWWSLLFFHLIAATILIIIWTYLDHHHH